MRRTLRCAISGARVASGAQKPKFEPGKDEPSQIHDGWECRSCQISLLLSLCVCVSVKVIVGNINTKSVYDMKNVDSNCRIDMLQERESVRMEGKG